MNTAKKPDTLTKVLLACGIAGPSIFIITFFIEGALRQDYDPMRYAVSSLSIGERGWIQIMNFLVSGTCIILFAIGQRRILRGSFGGMWGPLLIAIVGIGLIGAGIFVSDPVYGYPSDLPLLLKQESTNGLLHQRFSGFAFLGLPIACLVFRRKFKKEGKKKWAGYCLFSCIGMFSIFIVAGIGFARAVENLAAIAGVFQRLSIIIGLTWIAVLSWYYLRNQSSDNCKPKTVS